MDPLPAYVAAVVSRIRSERPRTRAEVQRIKLEAARDHPVGRVPPNSTLLNALSPSERSELGSVLVKKPTRSLSGVAIVTVQSPPEACPHGTCTFCPGGPRFGTAQSYTGHEPAARRAARHGFDAFEQARARLAELAHNGHPVDKVELIVQGGTFPAREPDAQRAFVLGLYDALNSFGQAPQRSPSLREAQTRNESAISRCVGLTLETKPDWCFEPHLDVMLELGTTRVEVGVQTVFDDVLAATHRGHTMADTVRASQLARDAGLKVCYHLMPGLPGSSEERDVETARQVFADERLRPDMLKIYPTLVVPGTALWKQWQAGSFEPLTDEDAARIVARIKALVPPWVRIQRVERDIPTHQIAAGVMHTNLRQMAVDVMGRPCRCLRCREAPRQDGGFGGAGPTAVGPRLGGPGRLGLSADAPREVGGKGAAGGAPSSGAWQLIERAYDASGGREHFLSYEDVDRDSVVAYCRLRIPSQEAHRSEVRGRAIVRELKVVGREVPIASRPGGAGALQHRGFGRDLLARAEELARAQGIREMLVMSAVGTRAYYAKWGYATFGPYVMKPLQ